MWMLLLGVTFGLLASSRSEQLTGEEGIVPSPSGWLFVCGFYIFFPPPSYSALTVTVWLSGKPPLLPDFTTRQYWLLFWNIIFASFSCNPELVIENFMFMRGRRQGKEKGAEAAAARKNGQVDAGKRERVLHQHRQAYVWQPQTPVRHKGDRRSRSVSHAFTTHREVFSRDSDDQSVALRSRSLFLVRCRNKRSFPLSPPPPPPPPYSAATAGVCAATLNALFSDTKDVQQLQLL